MTYPSFQLSKTSLDDPYSSHTTTTTVVCLVPRNGIMLHNDNALSYTAGTTFHYLAENNIKVIEHPPDARNWQCVTSG